MKITISSTTKTVQINGVRARIWEGHTESGIPVHCYVSRVAVPTDQDQTQFQRELQEHQAPSAEVNAIPLRLIL
jgi:hypothetical protein